MLGREEYAEACSALWGKAQQTKGNAHLEDTHAKCVSQNLVSVMIIAVSDVSGSHKQRKWVFLLWI